MNVARLVTHGICVRTLAGYHSYIHGRAWSCSGDGHGLVITMLMFKVTVYFVFFAHSDSLLNTPKTLLYCFVQFWNHCTLPDCRGASCKTITCKHIVCVCVCCHEITLQRRASLLWTQQHCLCIWQFAVGYQCAGSVCWCFSKDLFLLSVCVHAQFYRFLWTSPGLFGKATRGQRTRNIARSTAAC